MRSIYDYIPTLIGISILVFILVGLYRTSINEGRSRQLILFTFATAGLLLSGLYWLAYDILYPLERMPFAANEIAEWAMFLSLASTLGSMINLPSKSSKWEIAFAVIFMLANVALWIAWSGEWVQDIITGIVFCYFLINLVRFLNETTALTRLVEIVLAVICVVIITANIATFFVTDSLTILHDHIAYTLLCIVDLYFVIRAIVSISKMSDPGVSAAMSFSAAAWSIVYMYMSSGMFYNIANISLSVSFILMYVSLKREVSHDLC